MILHIAGGVGEHGRNCFYVKGSKVSFLVDCGLMVSEGEQGCPRLTKEEIDSLDGVFLTHSHADHTGALPWLTAKGYPGPVIATRETLQQCGNGNASNISLQDLCPGGTGRFMGIDIEWGRSGHCEGGVWYRFTLEGASLLFSGDYTEETQVYSCDRIRGKSANLAILDCAYGDERRTYQEYCDDLLESVRHLLEENHLVMLPIPKHGRGVELLRLFSASLTGVRYYGDATFVQNVSNMKDSVYWYHTILQEQMITLYENENAGLVFVSDPQLRTKEARSLADRVLLLGGTIVMTGTVEPRSYSEELLQKGQMKQLFYPVHLNKCGYELLKEKNEFDQTIPFHSEEMPASTQILTVDSRKGDTKI